MLSLRRRTHSLQEFRTRIRRMRCPRVRHGHKGGPFWLSFDMLAVIVDMVNQIPVNRIHFFCEDIVFSTHL